MLKYPWGNLQGLNLAWFLEKFNQLLEDWATAEAGIDGALDDEIQKAEDALSDVFDARDAAAASATAAAGSATQAGTSATAAQNSATAAASSATLANNNATAAGVSEANAAQSASQAALSATNAGNSATAAGNSATAAGNSATAAGNSATAAGNSASAAAISETNAATSAQEAEDVLDSIPEDYSALSNNVEQLLKIVPLTLELGRIRLVSGSFDYQTTNFAVRTPQDSIIPVKHGDKIIFDSSLFTSISAFAVFDKTQNTRLFYSSTATEYTFTTDYANIAICIESSHTCVDIDTTKIAKIQSNSNYKTQLIIAPVLENMTADTALIPNDLRIVENTLYKITANIANGAALTPGTNCTATTIASILKQLLT